MSFSSSNQVSGKRKRVSKNKKKTWRKTNVEDVEDHLEDQRFQERTGGIRADKTDDQLFFVDTASIKIEQETETRSPRKKKREAKQLKCHALLEPDANIKPAKVTRNVKQETLKKRCTEIQIKTELGLLRMSERKRLGQIQRQEAVLRRQTRVKKQADLPKAEHDLWADSSTDGDIDEHYLKQTKRMRKRRPEHLLRKSSGVPAVEVPHPGSSYNPDYDDHQELLGKAVKVEEDKEKQQLKIRRALDNAFPKTTAAALEHNWIKEMSTGMGGHESETDLDETAAPANPPVRRDDKKTERQRRKELAQKQLQKETTQLKVENMKKNEIFRLKRIKQDLTETEKVLAQRRQRKVARKNAAKDQPKKLGKLKYEDPDLEIKLTDELVGSLRELKPEGHLMEDRFRSLQKRNIIEPRQRTKVTRKYKRKAYTKKSHRDL